MFSRRDVHLKAAGAEHIMGRAEYSLAAGITEQNLSGSRERGGLREGGWMAACSLHFASAVPQVRVSFIPGRIPNPSTWPKWLLEVVYQEGGIVDVLAFGDILSRCLHNFLGIATPTEAAIKRR